MKFKFLNTSLVSLILSAGCLVNISHAGLITLGDSLSGGGVDGWQAIMVINENDAYTNTSGTTELVTLSNFNFTVGNYRGQVTPFVVKINNATTNDFTLMAIGDTRYSGLDYFGLGDVSFGFSAALNQFSLAAGETITSGFLDADANGVSSGSVIPFIGGDSLFLTGGSGNSQSGNLSQGVGNSPTFGASTFNNGLSRDYSYNITAEISSVPEPTTLAIFALGMIGLASRRLKKKS
ncbi:MULTISPECIES: PEP-CTERM sorting domain-containing protein [unclassified Colwellia]|uniref:PEP-CTERM sorting domain-containing protein n=1 Tax=unclassified Colwellia TaxID=196834 RepID=UPI0015F69A43|nr:MULTISPECIES: PEP-CTERM sorting domain-containing protein [unclassified Colwellia]MBA6378614.1 PEP-CTERM sorting domain-containing protein [Colwellia sp. BRX10-7]MBA6385908.1 PEP-CTERM sorting domain-containing protein [Colwellia sp. BRX10-2]MBA6401189.1 PEP-CTERM sorting domain-containing protein [Colwellia sp. BRX10-5]MBA6404592.1 PEP-CTERM sorting domain-containing protein [Colwellia sp. BRX10-1]